MAAPFELLLITLPAAPLGVIGSVAAALEGLPANHRVAVQLRARDLPRDALAQAARELRAITRAAGALLLINGDVELAGACAADGVHLPEAGPPPLAARAQLGPAALIGRSCHDPVGLALAARDGATYATLSPVFESPGKGPALGLKRFAEWTRAATLPVIALGGVTAHHAPALKLAGASGLAVISAVFAAPDRARAARELLDAWR